ncbi:GINS3 [Mytilus coruscus]|uniref:DNA replication complex GINS protein PSF3 n=1 Tax=Mytilus coruscus TaxID=42192 RepID=A0A6J8C2D5_MYTCO|nr:GINS3 [Mytilus coruscus]
MTSENVDDYFSISDILTTQERLPCKVELPIYRLGYLDTSSTSDDLQPGTKLDLSFWMARALCSRKRHIVSVEMPRPYREGYREILTADANVVDLHKLGPYYYSYGVTVTECFQTRIRKIMDSSQNAYNEDTTKLTEKLDETEKCLFKAGQIGLNDFQRWETRQTEKLTTSEMVRSHRKRKRALMDDS